MHILSIHPSIHSNIFLSDVFNLHLLAIGELRSREQACGRSFGNATIVFLFVEEKKK